MAKHEWYLERYVVNPEQLKEKTLKEVAESGKDWAHNSYFRAKSSSNVMYPPLFRLIYIL